MYQPVAGVKNSLSKKSTIKPRRNEVDPAVLVKFTDELKYFDTYKKEPLEIASDLFEIAPKNLDQFFGSVFSKCAYQEETFRFIGDSNIPYTKNGRNCRENREAQMYELKNWKVEPLSEF